MAYRRKWRHRTPCWFSSLLITKMDTTYHLPLNVYVIVLGIGLFVFMLSLIFCCYLFRLKQQGTREQFSYNEVGLSLHECDHTHKHHFFFLPLKQTCAVCLEEFRTRDELAVCPCSHAFHKKCLLKWLEIRSVCPMCNKPILRLHPDPTQGTEGPQDPEEV
uniref:Zgc:175214 n=1 Tax=Salmo trutta TaxID=8032 RepID=A0A674EMX0_SALTR